MYYNYSSPNAGQGRTGYGTAEEIFFNDNMKFVSTESQTQNLNSATETN